MKCEHFLPGWRAKAIRAGPVARQHARSCQSCRDAARILDEVKQELADCDPLPDRLKRVFVTASETKFVSLPEPTDVRRSRAGLWWVALAAAVLIATSPWLLSLTRHAKVAEKAPDHDSAEFGEQRRVGPITIVTVDPAYQLAQLEVDLATLKI